ncbi:hypothetical protein NDU88_001235 [Pleurodeles waltl]|uniref:Uncharacterized protein n=1 Tax=Pleurodeles waltl TaxID=8319 RepID=A0AAV7L8Z3_PLEWA|nr:hypothetical protein NDU88_001235 [Pleurodeles waltl]
MLLLLTAMDYALVVGNIGLDDTAVVVKVCSIFEETFVGSAVYIFEVVTEAEGDNNIIMGDVTVEKVEIIVVAVAADAIIDKDAVNGVVDENEGIASEAFLGCLAISGRDLGTLFNV